MMRRSTARYSSGGMRLSGKVYRRENYHLDSFLSNREQNFQTGLIFTPLKFGICEGISPNEQKGNRDYERTEKSNRYDTGGIGAVARYSGNR